MHKATAEFNKLCEAAKVDPSEVLNTFIKKTVSEGKIPYSAEEIAAAKDPEEDLSHFQKILLGMSEYTKGFTKEQEDLPESHYMDQFVDAFKRKKDK